MVNILKSSFWNLFGTFIVIVSGAVLSLVAPKILSVEDFGLWRMFMLYSTYAGILHLGIADGFMLNNVALDKQQAFKNLKSSLPFLVAQQILCSTIIFLVLLYFIDRPSILMIVGSVLLYSITLNIRTLVDNYLLIIKDFKTSNIVKILDKVAYLVLIIITIAIFQLSYQNIIVFSIVASILALLILIWKLKPRPDISKAFFKNNVGNIKVGSQLLYSNIFIIVLFNIDSVVVNMFLGIKDFAVFSFAITIIMLINQFAESISQVFFPYLATDLKENLFKVNKIIVLAIFGIWLLILQFSYLFVPVIEFVFPEYRDSIPILLVYLLTSLFTLLIRVSQNNLYKVQLLQMRFVKIELVVFVLTVVFLFFFHNQMELITISIIIMVTRAVWYVLNEIGIANKDKSVFYILLGFILYSLIYVWIYFKVDLLWAKSLFFLVISLPIYIRLIRKIKIKKDF